MKILHICNDFFGSKVHSNLYLSLSNYGFKQIVYSHLRKKTSKSINPLESSSIEIVRGFKTSNIHRILFRYKENLLFEDLVSKIDLSDVDLVHTSTLFTDGVLAYKIFKKYNIPYVLTVRQSDIFSFMRYRLDLFIIIRKTIINSKKVIFITPSLKEKFLSSFFNRILLKKITFQSEIINNGIDDFWIENKSVVAKPLNHNLLYVGNFTRNKNVLRLIESILILKETYSNINLDIVGSGGADENKVLELCKKNDFINYKGVINDKAKLLNLYKKSNLLIMISKKETFGLVYLEALSQNTPVIFSKNTGIDGFFDSSIGLGIMPKSIDSLTSSIKEIFNNYDRFNNQRIDFNKFNWLNISKKYSDLYYKIHEK